MLRPLSDKSQPIAYKPFLFDVNSAQQSSIFELELIYAGVKYRYEVELDRQAVLEEKLYFFNPNRALVYKRTTDKEKQLSFIQFGSKIEIDKNHKIGLEANTLWNNTVLGGYLKTNFDAVELQAVTSWFRHCLRGMSYGTNTLTFNLISDIISDSVRKDKLIKALQKADFNINDIILEDSKDESKVPRLFFQHQITKGDTTSSFLLELQEQSKGTIQYFFLAALSLAMELIDIVLPIDELEASLHPDLLEHFLLTFLANVRQSQLIATTHQRELLLQKDMLRHDAIWFTEKKPNGSTDLFSLADFDSVIVRKSNSIYNTYKIGKLGAKPNLGDYYLATENGEK